MPKPPFVNPPEWSDPEYWYRLRKMNNYWMDSEKRFHQYTDEELREQARKIAEKYRKEDLAGR